MMLWFGFVAVWVLRRIVMVICSGLLGRSNLVFLVRFWQRVTWALLSV
jgi:hypothetical protein